MRKNTAGLTFTYAILVVWSLVCLFPLYWVLITSFKDADAIMGGARYLPFVDFWPTLESWHYILFDATDNLVQRYLNSLLVSGMATLLTVIMAALMVYAVTRLLKPGQSILHPSRHPLLAFILATRVLPPVVLVLPLYMIAQFVGSRDSIIVLAFVYTAMNLPVAIWLLLSSMGNLRTDQEEAALLEGASQPAILFGILLPMIWGQVCAAGFIIFILCWNEYLFAAFLTTDQALTMPPFLVGQMSAKEAQIAGEAEEWAQFSAASVLMMAPLLLGAGWLQRQLTRHVSKPGKLSR